MFHTTAVFTSLGLLYNLCMCKQLEWKVMAVSDGDGTDNTTNNNWQLLTMGCFSINSKGAQQYQPFFFILAPGEWQEIFGLGVLALLKYSRCLCNIKNFDFLGGVINDATEVFSNVFCIALPCTKLWTCATQIRRKVSVGKGNGVYSKYVNTKRFLADTVIHDVRNLTNCVND